MDHTEFSLRTKIPHIRDLGVRILLRTYARRFDTVEEVEEICYSTIEDYSSCNSNHNLIL